jgi:hypothetical protein
MTRSASPPDDGVDSLAVPFTVPFPLANEEGAENLLLWDGHLQGDVLSALGLDAKSTPEG